MVNTLPRKVLQFPKLFNPIFILKCVLYTLSSCLPGFVFSLFSISQSANPLPVLREKWWWAKNWNSPWSQFPIGQSCSYISWTFSYPWCLCVLVGYVLLCLNVFVCFFFNIFVVLFWPTILFQSLLLSHISTAPQSNGHWKYRGLNNHTRCHLRISVYVQYLQYLQYL